MYMLRELGDPILLQKAAPVSRAELKTREVQEVLQVMKESMEKSNGVGIAAPQVWASLRMFMIDIHPTPNFPDIPTVPLKLYINPEILAMSEESAEWREWCLSIPGIRARIRRSKQIEVKYRDEDNALHKETLEWFAAVVFQHEFDHLEWVLFLDRVSDTSKLYTQAEFQKAKDILSSRVE